MGSSPSHNGKIQPHEACQRRKILSNIKSDVLQIQKGIRCITEYVECPRGNVIYTKCFIPDSSIIEKPKGLICQTIGYTSYSDYDFTLTAQEYCKRGYIYFIWDHYGHGRSSGLWVHIPNIQWLLDDTIFICNYAQKKYALKNNYLFGSSMGGCIVCRIIIEIQKNKTDHPHKNFISKARWNGIVLFAPMAGIDETHLYHPAIMHILQHWLAYYFPKAILLPKTVSPDISALSRDRKMAVFMSENPLAFPFGARLKTAVELVLSAQYVEEHSALIGLTDIPLFVMHGNADNVTKSSVSLKMVDKVSKSQTIKDATHRLLDGAYHGLLVDKCRYECIDESVQWMDNHNNK